MEGLGLKVVKKMRLFQINKKVKLIWKWGQFYTKLLGELFTIELLDTPKQT